MTKKASDVWKLLHGVICTYKPPGCSSRYVAERLIANICKDLNSLEILPPRPYLDVDRSGPEIKINVRPSYADNILCSGPRYHRNNVTADVPIPLGDIASGVLLVCINGGNEISYPLKRLNFTRCYQIKGILGQATVNFHIDEKVVARAKFKHVTEHHFQKTLASYQSALQRRMFEEYGFHLQTEEAYKFAVKGLYRPGRKSAPITYGLRLLELKPPNFTLEIQCIGETETYLMNFIHNLGVSLKCYATCEEIRCIRHGCFHTDHALLRRQWTVDNILDNLELCWKILEDRFPDKFTHTRTVETVKA